MTDAILNEIRMDEIRAYIESPEAADSYDRARAALKGGEQAMIDYLTDNPEQHGKAKAFGAQFEGRELPNLALMVEEELRGYMDGVERWPDGRRKGLEFLRLADECERRADALLTKATFLERRQAVYKRMGQ